jgi:flagellar secretion chaperone FliS
MVNSGGYSTYKNNSINYASKEQLLLMLLEGAVKYSKIGRQAILDKNITAAHENIVKTQNIFYELMATLDKSAGKWAESLMKVYEFITDRLVQANMKKDIEIMNEVIPLIEEIRNIWTEAYSISKNSKKAVSE